jgi:hypothetical protein
MGRLPPGRKLVTVLGTDRRGFTDKVCRMFQVEEAETKR